MIFLLLSMVIPVDCRLTIFILYIFWKPNKKIKRLGGERKGALRLRSVSLEERPGSERNGALRLRSVSLEERPIGLEAKGQERCA